MSRSPTRTLVTIAIALAFVTTSGCDSSPKTRGKHRPRSSAVAHCAGYECKVRVTCKGRVYVRLGPAPVRIQTERSALRTTVYADFAGSKHDAVVRC